jgi:hypothetical protein
MCDIVNRFDQYGLPTNSEPTENYKKLVLSYRQHLLKIKKDFYSVLWQDNLQIKFENDSAVVHNQFQDGHPSPLEHLEYVENTFWNIGQATKEKIHDIQTIWTTILKENCSNKKYSLSNYSEDDLINLKKRTTLLKSSPIIKF